MPCLFCCGYKAVHRADSKQDVSEGEKELGVGVLLIEQPEQPQNQQRVAVKRQPLTRKKRQAQPRIFRRFRCRLRRRGRRRRGDVYRGRRH